MLFRHLDEGNEKNQENSVRIADIPAEIRDGHLSNTSQRRYNLSQLVPF
jgi:hypothetical protein